LPHQLGELSALGYSFSRIEAVIQSVFVAAWNSWRYARQFLNRRNIALDQFGRKLPILVLIIANFR
jgi:hypothetical protein